MEVHWQTPVHTLVAAYIEAFALGEEPMHIDGPSFVYDISPDGLPPDVVATVAKAAPNFKPLFSGTLGETGWANACVHCGLLQGAFFLHSEPGGPFFGGPEDFAGVRSVVSERNFDVEGDSYSL